MSITPERARDEIARAVEAASADVMRAGDSPRVRADGFAYLARLAEVALQQQLHGADAAYPRFVANPNVNAKWGAENADNRYLWARDDPARVAAQIEAAAAWTLGTARFWHDWVVQLRAGHVPGQLAAPRRYEGGADDILYGNDWFQLGNGEALVVECDAPDATPTAACASSSRRATIAVRQRHVAERMRPG